MQEVFSIVQAKPAHPKQSFTLRAAGIGDETLDQDGFLCGGSTTELQAGCQVWWHTSPQGGRTSGSFCAAPATETT